MLERCGCALFFVSAVFMLITTDSFKKKSTSRNKKGNMDVRIAFSHGKEVAAFEA